MSATDEQLAAVETERDALAAKVARVEALCEKAGDLDNGLLVWDVIRALRGNP